MSDNYKGPCGEHCAVVEMMRARESEIERLRAELAAANARERLKDELLKDTRPFCYGCAYVKDGRLADRYATKKGNE